ncbi:DNA-3-methyladenine glycosylase [Candidatus Parcubacteria bacterium]|nr:DNA-3-methyladenine glycosylase [Candidatus Parcubacteria bacterium]
MNWKSTIIPRKFYDRDPVIVAQQLLGKFLVRKIGDKYLVGLITETEAYLPSGDAAAHNFKGKTKRNESLYKEAGHAYVHSMRQYFLFDVVTEGADKPGSVLIRAIEPIEGIDGIKTDGPGKVCIALSINRTLDGTDITNPESEIFIAQGEKDILHEITTSSRIGISNAKDMPLRFHITENIHVSKKR